MKKFTERLDVVQGASSVVVALYLCLLGATLYTGVYLWANRPAPTLVGAVALRTYTDTARLYTISYPASWKLVYDPSEGSEGLAPTTDWSYQSRGYTLMNSNAPNGSQGISVHVDEGDMVANMVEGFTHDLDKFHTVQISRINGYTAYYEKVDFVGPSDAERYTDHYYHILSENNLITLSFRESYYHNYPYENWNDSGDLDAFQAVVRSVKFL